VILSSAFQKNRASHEAAAKVDAFFKPAIEKASFLHLFFEFHFMYLL
jgi:hypothetical protein